MAIWVATRNIYLPSQMQGFLYGTGGFLLCRKDLVTLMQ